MSLATELFTHLAANPYFSAGFGLFGLGSLATVARYGGVIAVAGVRRHFVTSVQVPCNDKSYHWVLDWVVREAAGTSQHLAVRTDWEEGEGGRVRAKYLLEPSPGTHVFRWGGAWVRLDRTREQHQVDVIGGVPWETVTLTTIGRRRNLLMSLLDQAREEALARHQGLTTTYGTSGGGGWNELGPAQPARLLESVVLEEGLAKKLVSDCEMFLSGGSWYRNRGIPHRRGVLLHGPPGCGKTSLIVALAGHLDLGISTLSLADPQMTDSRLMARVADIPRDTILLLEDIDAAFVSREEGRPVNTAHGGLSQVTLTGLLNALDGVVASDGRLTFLTTNYPDRLDPALIRPGRVDMKVYIGHCSLYTASKMFTKFYPESSELEASEFARRVLSCGQGVSPAQVQAHLLIHREDRKMAIKQSEDVHTL